MILFVPASRVSGLIDLRPDGIGSKSFGKQFFSLESKKNRRMGEFSVWWYTLVIPAVGNWGGGGG